MLRPCRRAAVLAALGFGCSEPAGSPDRSEISLVTGPVSAAGVRLVTVQPATATIDVGKTVQLTATAKPNKPVTFTWTSSNASVATVSSAGLVRGIAGGAATIAAASGGAQGTSSVTVKAVAVPVASVTVTPNPTSVAISSTVQLTATLKDANGGPLTGRTVTWGSSATAIATVGASGLVSGVASGTATITATSEGKNGTTALTVTAVAPPPPPGGSVLLAAGDISSCSSSGDAATATLLDGLAGTIVTLGDNVYADGTASQFTNCYHPTWGRHKARTRPSPGNHDYHTSGAAAYYSYFGTNAGPAGRGYYSFDLGAWHVVSLNSNVSMSADSAQERWLRADLAASAKPCTLAYWHHPRFSSGTKHGNFSAAQPIWQALYDRNADVVLAGHEHNYERFDPQRADGTADAAWGLREFVVGTGGIGHYDDRGTPKPNSQLFNGTTYGVLKLTLGASSYSWKFVPVAGQSFTDSGTGACH